MAFYDWLSDYHDYHAYFCSQVILWQVHHHVYEFSHGYVHADGYVHRHFSHENDYPFEGHGHACPSGTYHYPINDNFKYQPFQIYRE